MSAGQAIVDEVRSCLTEASRSAIEGINGDRVVFPAVEHVDQRGSDGRIFLGWPEGVLVIAEENQGVCTWGVSLAGKKAGAVVVAGALSAGPGTHVYSEDIEAYVEAGLWDARLFGAVAVLQAQAIELDAATIGQLNERFERRPLTHGWPCRSSHRFEAAGCQMLLWDCADQCDWWISGDPSALARCLTEILDLSDLRSSLWSNDPHGMRVLEGHPSVIGP